MNAVGDFGCCGLVWVWFYADVWVLGWSAVDLRLDVLNWWLLFCWLCGGLLVFVCGLVCYCVLVVVFNVLVRMVV